MNHVALIGRITKDLQLRTTSTGKSYVFFTIAVSSTVKDRPADFLSCVAWNEVAKNMCNYLIKGSLVSVTGRIATRKSTYEGKEQYITEIIANSVQFLDNRKKEVLDNNLAFSDNEKKINLDVAFKSPSYNNNFTNENSLKKETKNIIDSSFDDEESAIIWE